AATCNKCGLSFDPRVGSASGSKAVCLRCSHTFSIVKAVRASSQPPAHRLYGKLLLTRGEKKRYLPSTPQDLEIYEECSALLRQELDLGSVRLPQTILTDGHNTRQALSYNYSTWRDFFNDRQLLA